MEKEDFMPDQKCPKHDKTLEPDGLCHDCISEKSKESAKQFPDFAKKLAKRARGKKK